MKIWLVLLIVAPIFLLAACQPTSKSREVSLQETGKEGMEEKIVIQKINQPAVS